MMRALMVFGHFRVAVGVWHSLCYDQMDTTEPTRVVVRGLEYGQESRPPAPVKEGAVGLQKAFRKLQEDQQRLTEFRSIWNDARVPSSETSDRARRSAFPRLRLTMWEARTVALSPSSEAFAQHYELMTSPAPCLSGVQRKYADCPDQTGVNCLACHCASHCLDLHLPVVIRVLQARSGSYVGASVSTGERTTPPSFWLRRLGARRTAAQGRTGSLRRVEDGEGRCLLRGRSGSRSACRKLLTEAEAIALLQGGPLASAFNFS